MYCGKKMIISVMIVFCLLSATNVAMSITDEESGSYKSIRMDILEEIASEGRSGPPVANAGDNQTVDQGDSVTFNGSGSTDDVGIVNYTWTFTDDVQTILYEVSPAHTFENAGIYPVTLNVTDGDGNFSLDTMTVTVNDITTPTAIAGINQTVDQNTNVTLNGTGSSDNVGIETYTWTFEDLGARELQGISTWYVFDNAGVFIITLNVTDEAGNYDTDTVTITVNDTTDPVAEAGADQEGDQGGTITLDGSASSDNVGISNYTWSFFDGENRTLYGVSPNYTFNDPGTFLVTLVIMDAAGNSNTDNLTVTVRSLAEPKAVLNEIAQNLAINGSIVFNASLSEPGAGAAVVAYTWELERFGAAEWNGTGAEVEYTFPVWGIYEMSLAVTDSSNGTASTSVKIVVGRLINFTEITENCPENGSVLVEFNKYIESYYDGIIEVEWTIGNKKTTVSPKDFDKVNQTYSSAGSFNVTCIIVTGYGTFREIVEVTITKGIPTDNQEPVAKVPSLTLTNVQREEFTLDGSGSYDPDDDVDGNAMIDGDEVNNLTFSWTHTFANNSSAIDPNSHLPLSTPPGMTIKMSLEATGDHLFKLTVTDSHGASDSVEIIVTIKEDTTYFGDKGDPRDWTKEIKDQWNFTFGEYGLVADFDEDGDGIPNYKDGDIDGDGHYNMDEIQEGTDPTNKNSYPGKKKKEEKTSATLLIILLVIFVVILIIMIAIFTRGRGGYSTPKTPSSKEEDFF